MKDDQVKSLASEITTKILLTVGFFLLLALFILWQLSIGKSLDSFVLSASDLVLLAFATMRMGRLIAFDLVMEPLRAPFTRTVKDKTGAGDTVIARGEGVRRALGQLFCCPICVGTWAGALMVIGLYAWPGAMRVFVTILGIIGAAEVLNSLIEALSWAGFASRARSGAILKNGQSQENDKTDNSQF